MTKDVIISVYTTSITLFLLGLETRMEFNGVFDVALEYRQDIRDLKLCDKCTFNPPCPEGRGVLYRSGVLSRGP